MPEYSKDVMIALLGAAVSLAGLLLVVAGYVFAQVNSFPRATTDDSILKRYETAAKLGLIPFLMSLIEAALCLVWLICSSRCLYLNSVIGFFLLLVMTAAYGSVLILRYL
jgi:hypothetical protein